jgi:hypothetical protein
MLLSWVMLGLFKIKRTCDCFKVETSPDRVSSAGGFKPLPTIAGAYQADLPDDLAQHGGWSRAMSRTTEVAASDR